MIVAPKKPCNTLSTRAQTFCECPINAEFIPARPRKLRTEVRKQACARHIGSAAELVVSVSTVSAHIELRAARRRPSTHGAGLSGSQALRECDINDDDDPESVNHARFRASMR